MSQITVFRRSLAEKGFDAALISDKINQRYLSGFDFDDGYVLIAPEKAYLITDFRYVEAAKAQCGATMEILTPDHGMINCVRGLLDDEKCKTVAIEEDALSYGDFGRFGKLLPNVTLVAGASAILSHQRQYKTEEELDCMARAQAITDAAFAHIVNFIRPDMTEAEVALELEFFMRRNGSDGVAFPTIAVSGSNSSRPHGVPRHQKLEKGFLTMDFGASINGYCSDMTRTVVIGKADDKMKRLYQTVLDAQLAALDRAAEGVSCASLDKTARDLIDNAGYAGTFGHSLGHGVGLLIHENPRLSSRAAPEEVLQRGHVVTVEPGIYREGVYGCRIEDMIAIRPDGSLLNFTQSPKNMIEID